MRGYAIREGAPGGKIRARLANDLLNAPACYASPFSSVNVGNVFTVSEGGLAIMYLDPGVYVFDDPDNGERFSGWALVEPQQFLDVTHPHFAGGAKSNWATPVDCSAAFNAALAASETGHGLAWAPIGSFGIGTSLEHGMGTRFLGEHRTLTQLIHMDSLYGPAIYSRPTLGRAGDGQHGEIGNIFMDGNLVGLAKVNASWTIGNTYITLAGVPSPTPAVGWLVEGYGIPDDVRIGSIVGTTVNLVDVAGAPVAVTLTNIGTQNKPNVWMREAYKKSATAASTSSPFLAIVDTSGIQKGMRVRGANLGEEDNPETGDVNQSAMVVDVGGGGVTLDRNATSAGSFTATFWRENDHILITEAAQTPGGQVAGRDYEAPTLRDIIATQPGGSCIRGRPGRSRMHLIGGRFTNYGRKGVWWTANQDCYGERFGAGGGKEEAFRGGGISTLRLAGEFFDNNLSPLFPVVNFSGCPEVDFHDSDVNGLVRFFKSKKNRHLWKMRGIAMKPHNQNSDVDGVIPPLISINGAGLSVSQVGFESDQAAPNRRPTYLFSLQSTDAFVWGDVDEMTTDTSLSQTPFSIGICDVPIRCGIKYRDVTNARWHDTSRTLALGFSTISDIPPNTGLAVSMGNPSYFGDKRINASAEAVTGDAVSRVSMTNGGADTIGSAVRYQYYRKASNTAGFTVTLPPSPLDGQLLDIIFSTAVTSGLVIQVNTSAVAQTFNADSVAFPSTAAAGTVFQLQWLSLALGWIRRIPA